MCSMADFAIVEYPKMVSRKKSGWCKIMKFPYSEISTSISVLPTFLPIFHSFSGKRSNTLPSSSLSSIWSQTPASNSSQSNRTYANVLRQHDDPLMKIRQLGTKGSQELSEGSSETTSDGVQQPFSPFGARW